MSITKRLSKLLGWRRIRSAQVTTASLTERELQILERELVDSRRNAMASPGDSLSGGDAKSAAAAINPSRTGSMYATGIPNQALGETKGK